jgi:hypothetical protein
MEALEELYLTRRTRGWSLQVYDYTSNVWRDGEEAFREAGTYEKAVLKGPGTRPIRIRVVPTGGGEISMDAASAREMGTWRALGIELKGRHLQLIDSLLEALSALLPLGGGGP